MFVSGLTQTFGPKINAIAVADVPDLVQTFKRNGIAIGEGGNSFQVCNACRILAMENHAQNGKKVWSVIF